MPLWSTVNLASTKKKIHSETNGYSSCGTSWTRGFSSMLHTIYTTENQVISTLKGQMLLLQISCPCPGKYWYTYMIDAVPVWLFLQWVSGCWSDRCFRYTRMNSSLDKSLLRGERLMKGKLKQGFFSCWITQSIEIWQTFPTSSADSSSNSTGYLDSLKFVCLIMLIIWFSEFCGDVCFPWSLIVGKNK